MIIETQREAASEIEYFKWSIHHTTAIDLVKYYQQIEQ
jgi:hypothetical protein